MNPKWIEKPLYMLETTDLLKKRKNVKYMGLACSLLYLIFIIAYLWVGLVMYAETIEMKEQIPSLFYNIVIIYVVGFIANIFIIMAVVYSNTSDAKNIEKHLIDLMVYLKDRVE